MKRGELFGKDITLHNRELQNTKLSQRVEQLEDMREQDKCYVDDLESYVHELKSRLDAM